MRRSAGREVVRGLGGPRAEPAAWGYGLAVFEWIQSHPLVITGLAVASVVMFFGTLALMPVIVVRIPTDYFAHDRRPPPRWAPEHPVIRLVILVGKNLLGAIFIAAGLVMLVIPGQGVLTILIGFMLMDGPGKYRFEKWLVARRVVRRPIDWLRRTRGRPPLIIPAP